MRRWLPLALAVLLAAVLLPGLAAVEALDVREARDAEVMHEVTGGREWLTPVFARDPFFEKPLFAYATELAARHALRRAVPELARSATNIAASRAVRAAIAAALALVVAVVGARAFGARAGWLAGCALATSVGLPLAARADGGQLLATLCAWLGIGALLEVLQHRAHVPDASRAAAWFAFGAAALTGGPMPALWPLAGIALYFALARSHSGWRDVRPGSGLLIVLGMSLPWYGLMAALYHGGFLRYVPWFPYAADARDAGFAGPLLALAYPVVLGFPWAPMLAAALRDTAQGLGGAVAPDLRESGHAASLLLALLIAAMVPVALYPHPPLTAALPALPALALLCGRFVDRALDGRVEPRLLDQASFLNAAVGTAVALLIAFAAARVPAAAAGLRLLAAALLLASWTPALATLLGRRKFAVALFALPVALGAPIVATRVLPPLESSFNTREVALAMQAAAPPRAPLVMFDAPPPSLRLMLPRNIVVTGTIDPALAAADGHAYVAFTPDREADVVRAARDQLDVLVRTPALVLGRIAIPPRPAAPVAAGAAAPANAAHP